MGKDKSKQRVADLLDSTMVGSRKKHQSYPKLMKRSFNIDMSLWPNCGSEKFSSKVKLAVRGRCNRRPADRNKDTRPSKSGVKSSTHLASNIPR